METATLIVAVVSLVTAKVSALACLWLRLRWKTRHEQAQRDYLYGIAEMAAAGRLVEVDDQRGDGLRLRLKIATAPARGEDGTA